MLCIISWNFSAACSAVKCLSVISLARAAFPAVPAREPGQGNSVPAAPAHRRFVHWHAVAVYRFNLGHIVGDDQRSAGCRIKNPVADKTESFHSLARIVEDDFG